MNKCLILLAIGYVAFCDVTSDRATSTSYLRGKQYGSCRDRYIRKSADMRLQSHYFVHYSLDAIRRRSAIPHPHRLSPRRATIASVPEKEIFWT